MAAFFIVSVKGLFGVSTGEIINMSTQLITNINNEIYIGIVDTIVLRLIYNANTVYDKIVHVICLLQWLKIGSEW